MSGPSQTHQMKNSSSSRKWIVSCLNPQPRCLLLQHQIVVAPRMFRKRLPLHPNLVTVAHHLHLLRKSPPQNYAPGSSHPENMIPTWQSEPILSEPSRRKPQNPR